MSQNNNKITPIFLAAFGHNMVLFSEAREAKMSIKETGQKKSIARIFYEVELEKKGLPVDDDSFDDSLEKLFHRRAKKTEATKNDDLSSQLNQPPAFPLWMYRG